jgi:Domain of unknown function (DUF4331)
MQLSKGRMGAVAALVLFAGIIGQGSSHREAPGITKTPKLDGTDFSMFRSYESGRDGFVTLIANYIPLQAPYGGPNYFTLDADAVYEIHIDNDADAVEDITFQFRPSILVKDLAVPVGNLMVPVPLINIGQIGPDANATAALNREESYAVSIIRGDRRTGVGQAITNAADSSATFRKPVDYIGMKSIPMYAEYARRHIYDIAIPGCDNGRMFVGQRKDSFVVNLGETFDLVNVTNPLGPEDAEADDLADQNVTSFVLEVPIACLVQSPGQPIIGGWTTASLGVGQPAGTPDPGNAPCPAGQPAARRPTDAPGLMWVPDQSCAGWVPSTHPAARGNGRPPTPPPAQGMQLSRLSAPLVNEVVIGLRDKDLFNSATPSQDSALASYVTNPTLPELLEILFFDAGVRAPNNFPRNDLVAAFLTGIQGINRPANVVASEMLRLNTSIAPVAAASQQRLGALDGDTAGFPNGRRPGDDVVDIELRVAMGVLCHAFPGAFGCGPADAPSGQLRFTDGALVNSTFFDATFPYLRTPLRGSPNATP